jgi:hypothetical protein
MIRKARILEIKAENCKRRCPFILISAKSISDKPFQLTQTVRKLVPRRPFRFKKLDAILLRIRGVYGEFGLNANGPPSASER